MDSTSMRASWSAKEAERMTRDANRLLRRRQIVSLHSASTGNLAAAESAEYGAKDDGRRRRASSASRVSSNSGRESWSSKNSSTPSTGSVALYDTSALGWQANRTPSVLATKSGGEAFDPWTITRHSAARKPTGGFWGL
eukprot:TRINITY_DN48681_c0_g1_i1.p1 TRINITY_DN48681_c0_g1~~TRINITY_DN48681_c0_g1_i1.p1  ORF type:complete len:139 (+),score=17.46 TRINITY_DN48681_c0_g1_i1:59-475(+)